MHWLPLVAMVIASALPFPQSPVPRLVAATIEPGRNNSIPTAEINMTNSSDDRSQNNHSTHDATLHRTDNKQGTSEEDKTTGNQENLLTEHNFFNKTGGGRTTRADTSRSHDHRKYRSPKSLSKKVDILKEYQLERSQFHEESSIETKTDRTTGNNLQEKPLEGPGVSLESSPVQKLLNEDQMDGRTTEKESVKPNAGFRMEPGFGMDNVDLREEDQLLLLDAHPRVLFSSDPPKHPPLLLMLELGLLSEDTEDEESQKMDVTAPGGDKEAYRNLLLGLSDSEDHAPVRRKRQAKHNMQSRELSVCEAQSDWVIDRKTAVDNNHKNVTIVQDIQNLKQPLKQYFYETKCRESHPQGKGEGQKLEGAACLGVDKKQWLSRCETKQSYVRALTIDENMRMGWRWIRINSSCVCVLISRTKRNSERNDSKREGRSYG